MGLGTLEGGHIGLKCLAMFQLLVGSQDKLSPFSSLPGPPLVSFISPLSPRPSPPPSPRPVPYLDLYDFSLKS